MLMILLSIVSDWADLWQQLGLTSEFDTDLRDTVDRERK